MKTEDTGFSHHVHRSSSAQAAAIAFAHDAR
jgi:hypothetical protein